MTLAEIQYDKGYLGFKDSAINYSEQLFKDFQTYFLVRYLVNNHIIAHHLLDDSEE